MLTRAAPSRIADSAQRAVEGAARVAPGGGHRKDVRVHVSIDGVCWHRRSAHARLRRRRFPDRRGRRRGPAHLLALEEAHSTISSCRVAVGHAVAPPRRAARARRGAVDRCDIGSELVRDREVDAPRSGAASPLATVSRWRTPQLLGFLAPCTFRLARLHARTRHDCSPPRLRFEIGFSTSRLSDARRDIWLVRVAQLSAPSENRPGSLRSAARQNAASAPGKSSRRRSRSLRLCEQPPCP